MGRKRRNCPVLGCGSTNLVRLANHLHQVHHMNIEERSKWLKWSKMGICLPYLQSQETVVEKCGRNFDKTSQASRKDGEEFLSLSQRGEF